MLDNYCDQIVLPCLVKMDIDGAEMDALRGATKILGFHAVRWLIETHSLQLEQCPEVFAETGFQAKVIKNAWWRCLIPEQRPIPHNRWLVAVARKISLCNSSIVDSTQMNHYIYDYLRA
ncbi:MAG: hypothetical protein WCU74_01045 [Candidatus Omnitrophota bacterium]|jgi:hypothetical protein